MLYYIVYTIHYTILITVVHCLLTGVCHILLYTTFIAYDALGNTGETKLHGTALNCTVGYSAALN